MPIFKKNSQGTSSQKFSSTSLPKASLLSTEAIIKLSKEGGADFGTGNANERIRYFIKLGLLPHAVRKTTSSTSNSSSTPIGHLPYWCVERLIKITNLNKKGLTFPQIAQKLKQETQTALTEPPAPKPITTDTLFPTKEIVRLAKKGGADLGSGDTSERIRYFVKLGLLEHAVRKTTKKSNSTVGHLPYSTIERLIEITNLNKKGLTFPQIAEKLKNEAQTTQTLTPEQPITTEQPASKPAPAENAPQVVKVSLLDYPQSKDIEKTLKEHEQRLASIIDKKLNNQAQISVAYSAPEELPKFTFPKTVTRAAFVLIVFSLLSGTVFIGQKGYQRLSGSKATKQVAQDFAVSGQVLAASSANHRLYVDADSEFSGTTLFKENITAPNIIYSVRAGTGIAVSPGQNPTVSLDTTAIVPSVNDASGPITLKGSGSTSITNTGGVITISSSSSGLTSEADTLATVTGRGATTSTATSFTGGATVGTSLTLSTFSSDGGVLYTNGSGVLAQVTAGTATQCLLGGTTPSFGSCSTGGAMTSFTLSGDNVGSDQTISDGNTLEVAGGAGLTSTASATDTITLDIGAGTGITVNANDVAISATYTGQTSITTLGTIATGVWNGTTIAVANGGTGASTLTGILIGNGASAFTATTASSGISGQLTDETGSGALVFGTSPAITTSLTTGSTSFDLLNTTATTINFGQAATTLSIGPTGATATTIDIAGGSGATGCTVTGLLGNLTCSGDITSGATGTPTVGYWTRNTTSGYLYPATLTDNVGIGISSPTAQLHVIGGTDKGIILTSGNGSAGSGGDGSPGTDINLTSGNGGAGDTGSSGGPGGNINLTGGTGGATGGAGDGAGGNIVIAAGNGVGGGGGGSVIIKGGSGATTGTISVGTSNTSAVTIGSTSTTLNFTSGTGAQTHTSSVISGTGITSAFVFQDSALTTGTGIYGNFSALQNGKAVNITSASTAGTASDSDYLLYLARTGANSNTAHNAYGVYSTVTNTNGTSGTNIAGYFTASGATTANYGLWVNAGTIHTPLTGSSVVQTDSSGNLTTGTVTVAQGGTGLTTFGGTNTLLYTSTADNLTSLANGTTGQCLTATTASAPSWGSCAGTGVIGGSGTDKQIAFFNGTSSITSESSGFGWDYTNKLFTLTSTTATDSAEAIVANSLSSGSGLSITSTGTAATSNTQTGLNIALSGTNGTSTQTTYGLRASNTHDGTASTNVGGLFTATGGTVDIGVQIAAMTGATSTGIDIGAFTGATTNTGINITSFATGTTSKGIVIGTNSSATAYGIDIGALSGATVNVGAKIGAISGAGTGTGIDIGAFTNTGSTQYGINIGAFSGTHNGGTTAAINVGNISSAGTTTNNYGLLLGTLTGGTTANAQIQTGALTGIAGANNYGINLGAVSTTGANNYGIYIGSVTGGATTNYALYVAAGNVNIQGLSPSLSVYTDANRNLTTTAPTSGALGYWSRGVTGCGASTTICTATAGDNVTVDGIFTANGAVNLGDATSDDITFTGYVASSILPKTDDSYDLGDNTHRWANIFLGGETLHIGTSTTDEGILSYTTASNTLLLDNTATGIINIGTTALAQAITVGNNTTTTALNFTSGTGSQTFTSKVAIGSSATSAFVFTDTDLTSGTGIYANFSGSLSGSKGIDLNVTSTATTISNQYGIYSNFTASAISAAQSPFYYGLYQNIQKTGEDTGSTAVNHNVYGIAGIAGNNSTTFSGNANTRITTGGYFSATSVIAQASRSIGAYVLSTGARHNEGIEIAGISTAGLNNYGLIIGNMSGATSSIYGITIGTLGGGTGSSIYGINTGNLTSATSTPTAYQINLGTTAGISGATFGGINIGAISGAGTVSSGITIGANTSTATNNYGINIGALSGVGTNNYGIYIGSVTGGATTNYGLYVAAGNVNVQGLSASQLVLTDSNKNLVSATATAANTCSDCLIQVPLTTGRNTITPTAASVVALTVNGTSSTAATALSIVQGGDASAQTITANSISSGNILSISSTSTAAASNTQTGLNIALSGTNGTSTQTTYGLRASNTHDGTASTNVGGLFTATGGTVDIGVQIAAMTGATSTGIDIGALSGTTNDVGIKIGAISGSGAAGTGINIGAITSTGTANYGIFTGNVSGATNNYGIVASATTAAGNYALYTTAGNVTHILTSTDQLYLNGTNNTTTTGVLNILDTNATDFHKTVNIDTTYTLNYAGGAYGIYNNWASTATTTLDTEVIGIYNNVSKTLGSDTGIQARNFWASYNTATFTGGAGGLSSTNVRTYGGYFGATGDTAGTGSNTYGIFAQASGADNNYGIYSEAISSATTANYGLFIGALSGATTSKGIQIGALSSATSYGITIGALSGATANYGLNIGAISGALGTGINIGAITSTGAANYGIFTGNVSGATNNYGIVASATTAAGNYALYTTAGNITHILGATDFVKIDGSTTPTSTTTTGVLDINVTTASTNTLVDSRGINLSYVVTPISSPTVNTTYNRFGYYGNLTQAAQDPLVDGVTENNFGIYSNIVKSGTDICIFGFGETCSTYTNRNYGLYGAVSSAGTTSVQSSIGGYFSAAGAATGSGSTAYGGVFSAVSATNNYSLYSTATSAAGNYALYTASGNIKNILGASDNVFISATANTSTNGVLEIATTNTATTGATQYGIYNNWASSAVVTGTAQTIFGTYTNLAKTGADTSTATTTLYGTYGIASNTGATDAGTKNTYGGYFTAAGDTAGTATAYGIYATASGADNNYAALFSGTTEVDASSVFTKGLVVKGSSTFAAGSIATLKVWFAADAITGKNDGDAISTWNDSSTNANNATQATGSKQPLYKTNIINGKPIVRFASASKQHLVMGSANTLAADFSIFIVHQTSGDITPLGSSTANNQIRVGQSGANTISTFDATSNPASSALSTARTSWNIVEYVRSSGTVSFYEAGTAKSSGAMGNSINPDDIGGTSNVDGLYTQGDIAEIIVYSTALSSTDRGTIEQYLGNKYNIAVSTSPTTLANLQEWQNSAGVNLAAVTNNNVFISATANTSTNGVLEIATTNTATTGATQYGIYNNWASSAVVTGSAQTIFGTYTNLAKTGADSSTAASTFYGSYNAISDSGATNVASTRTGYAGFFNATVTDAGASSTSVAYGIYANATGGDKNVAGYFNGNLVQTDGTTATTKTTNYFLLNSTAGVVTGVPGVLPTGSVGITYDSTNFKLCAYVAAWKCTAALTDVAEWAPAPGTESGDLVAITNTPNPVNDPTSPTIFGKTTKPYDTNMAGVISEYAENEQSANGYKLSDDYHTLTLAGRIPVKVNTENGSIQPGDLLTSSSTPGVAMKADVNRGTIIGKALDAFSGPGQGKIVMFIGQENNPNLQTAYQNVNLDALSFSTSSNNTTIDALGNITTAGNIVTGGTLSAAGGLFTVDTLGNLSASTLTASQLNITGDATIAGNLTAQSILTSNLQALTASDLNISLGDNAGSNSLKLLDSIGNLILKIDSLGNADFAGTVRADAFETHSTADLAEKFPSQDSSIEAGDIVSVDPDNKEHIQLSNRTYDPTILGIISTKPGLTLNASEGKDQTLSAEANPKDLALAGRVPVKVSLENGPISAGDPITSSSTPGIGMKATQAGRVIGIALENFDNSQCNNLTISQCNNLIVVFVNPSWYTGTSLAANGSIVQDQALSTKVNPKDLALNSTTNADGTLSAPDEQLTMNNEQVKDYIDRQVDSKIDSLIASGKLQPTSYQSSSSQNQISAPVPTPQVAGTSTEATNSASPEASTAAAIKEGAQIAQETDATLNKLGELLSTVNLKLDTLNVIGSTNLANVQTAGTFSQDGTFVIDYGRQLNVLGSTLFLQNDVFAGSAEGILVDIGSGAVTIDKQGNIRTQGSLTSNQLTTKELIIDASDVNAKTVGSAQITSGKQSITIFTTALKPNAKVLLTPTGPTGGKSLYVATKSDFEGFTVNLDGGKATNIIEFDWLIVNTTQISQTN